MAGPLVLPGLHFRPVRPAPRPAHYTLALHTRPKGKAFLISRSKRFSQRVLNISSRTRVSQRRIIWLLPPTSPPFLVSKLSLFLSLPVCRRSSLLTEGGGGGGGGPIPYDGKNAHCPVLYKSFNTLCFRALSLSGCVIFFVHCIYRSNIYYTM
jgi:hypothetical protein